MERHKQLSFKNQKYIKMKELDKNKKLVIIFAPVIILFFAGLIYFKTQSESVTEGPDQNNQEIDLAINESEKPQKEKSRLELLRERSKSDNRGQVDQSDFYSLSSDTTIDLEQSRLEEEERLKEEARLLDSARKAKSTNYSQDPYSTSPRQTKQPKEKQKVVYVYRDAPTSKKEEPITQTPPTPDSPKETRARSRGVSYSTFESEKASSTASANIKCYISNDNKKIRSGSEVRLITADNTVIRGFNVPAGTTIIGIARLSSDKVNIDITELNICLLYTSPSPRDS